MLLKYWKIVYKSENLTCDLPSRIKSCILGYMECYVSKFVIDYRNGVRRRCHHRQNMALNIIHFNTVHSSKAYFSIVHLLSHKSSFPWRVSDQNFIWNSCFSNVYYMFCSSQIYWCVLPNKTLPTEGHKLWMFFYVRFSAVILNLIALKISAKFSASSCNFLYSLTGSFLIYLNILHPNTFDICSSFHVVHHIIIYSNLKRRRYMISKEEVNSGKISERK
jgi:hypothetical protein